MPGNSGIFFWLNMTAGAPVIWNTYSITKANAAGVKVDGSALSYTIPPKFEVTETAVNLAFAVGNADSDKFAHQNFVVGSKNDIPPGDVIDGSTSRHDNAQPQTLTVNFITNTVSASSSDVSKRRKAHGILNIIGWGILLPVGAMAARYGKQYEPHWFYAHAAFQVTGFAIVLAGLITGLNLRNDFPDVDIDKHQGLGIFIFVLATIQISAILIRPKKDAKVRRYWNWGHWWTGRIAIVLAIVNTFVGIYLTDVNAKKWKEGYGVTLAINLVQFIVMETLLWVRWAKEKKEPRLPETAMPNRHSSPNGAAPPPAYDSGNWDN